MLDVSSFTLSSDNAEVEPSDNIFIELGKNTYNYQDLISELIDNTIAARRPDRLLEVSIELFVDEDGNPTDFVIRDNASGISPDQLGSGFFIFRCSHSSRISLVFPGSSC